MFNRRIFYLIVLSILHDHKEGLSAYQLLKILKEHFTPLWNPSAGALYPLLRKMTITGEIKEEMGDSDQSRFVITEIGLKRLQDIIPEVLNTSFESLPLIFDALSKVLPYASRMRFAHHVPHIFRMMAQNFPFNEPARDEHFNGYSTSTRMERLENYKADLNKAKEEIQSWATEETARIDAELRWIDERLEICQDDKQKNWVKIPIIDEDHPDHKDSDDESSVQKDSYES